MINSTASIYGVHLKRILYFRQTKIKDIKRVLNAIPNLKPIINRFAIFPPDEHTKEHAHTYSKAVCVKFFCDCFVFKLS